MQKIYLQTPPPFYDSMRLVLNDPIVQWPRTLPFHGGNTGSNPVRVAMLFAVFSVGGSALVAVGCQKMPFKAVLE